MLLRGIVFYALAFAFTIVLGGIQEAAGFFSEKVIIPQLAPGLTALLMLALFRKDKHRFSVFDRRVPAPLYVLAATGWRCAGGLSHQQPDA